jgi:TonB family protein
LSTLKTSPVEIVTENVEPYDYDKNQPKPPQIPDEFPIAVVNKAAPSYVDAARTKRVQGRMRLRCVFTDNGFVQRVEFINLLDGLARQALFAALRLKFLPKEKDGVPQTVKRVIEYHFSLY